MLNINRIKVLKESGQVGVLRSLNRWQPCDSRSVFQVAPSELRDATIEEATPVLEEEARRVESEKAYTQSLIEPPKQQVEQPQLKVVVGIKTNHECCKNCWYAFNLLCQCSCAGKNHGIAHDPNRETEFSQLYWGDDN